MYITYHSTYSKKAITNIIDILVVILNSADAATTVAMPILIMPLAVVIVRLAVVIALVAVRKAERQNKIGTPNAILQTLANTKYSTGIAKESCKR